MGSTEVAEPRSGADPDFSDAAKVITENAGKRERKGAQGSAREREGARGSAREREEA